MKTTSQWAKLGKTKSAQSAPDAPFARMAWIRGGTFQMGSDEHYPEEAPAHQATVSSFWIDHCTVTNREFRQFVDATKYVTLAERPANPADYPGAKPELLVPSSVVFRMPPGPVDLRNHYQWWTYVAGANWRHPWGPESSLKGLADHPVVHVAYEDAEAYARWIGKELPTEAEWEFAARGGLEAAEFVWGEELTPGGVTMANTWEGVFPFQKLPNRRYEWTAPVGSFPANGYGLHDVAGNVWEWTSDPYRAHAKSSSCCGMAEPQPSVASKGQDPCADGTSIPTKVMKGGSFLCAPNYCRRYRPAARMAQQIDTSTCHLGFRCIIRASTPPG